MNLNELREAMASDATKENEKVKRRERAVTSDGRKSRKEL